eukprot:1494645-Amphidinium_carterae.1
MSLLRATASPWRPYTLSGCLNFRTAVNGEESNHADSDRSWKILFSNRLTTWRQVPQVGLHNFGVHRGFLVRS